MQDRSHAIRDKIGRLEVDFIDLFFAELTFAGVYILQSHQEDHGAAGFFIGAI